MSADNASLIDPYGRHVGSLRVSVTQRCDLSCGHCHKEGQTFSREEMSPEEIARIVRVGASLGIRKVKLTGG
ncbi:MAG: radical SAM protein, partial [Thermoplasmata archaeon]